MATISQCGPLKLPRVLLLLLLSILIVEVNLACGRGASDPVQDPKSKDQQHQDSSQPPKSKPTEPKTNPPLTSATTSVPGQVSASPPSNGPLTSGSATVPYAWLGTWWRPTPSSPPTQSGLESASTSPIVSQKPHGRISVLGVLGLLILTEVTVLLLIYLFHTASKETP